MPLPSIFTPFGLFEFGEDPSRAERIYDALVKSQGGNFDTESEGSLYEGRLYGWAMGIACAQSELQRAGNQWDERFATDQLPTLERQYSVVPPREAALDDRQLALVAKRKLPHGATRVNLEALLSAALGADFVALRTVPKVEAEQTPDGDPTLGPGTFKPAGTLMKLLRTNAAISLPGAPRLIFYTPVFGATSQLPEGAEVVLDPDKDGLRERLTVTGDNGSSFFATPTKAHAAGAIITSGPFPYWLSTRKHYCVVVPAGRAGKPEVRRKVHEVLELAARGNTTWDIVEAKTASTAGPFNVGGGANPGKIGVTPIGAISF